ncbi:hypothetical protein ACVXHA_15570 [Escherichia coli]
MTVKNCPNVTGRSSVMQYRDDGYLPEALLNYLVRLGWSTAIRKSSLVKR